MDRRQMKRSAVLCTQKSKGLASLRFGVKGLVGAALCTLVATACGARSELWMGEVEQGGSGGTGGTGAGGATTATGTGAGTVSSSSTSTGSGGTTVPPSCSPLCPDDGCSVQVLADQQETVWGIDTDSTHVYWIAGFLSDPNQVLRVPKEGGPVEVIKGNATSATDLEMVGDYLYWSESGATASPPSSGGIFRWKTSGGAVEVVVSQQYVFNLTSFENDIYWVDGGDDTLYQLKSGGMTTNLGSINTFLRDMITDGTSIYYAWSKASGGGFESMPIGGTTITTLADGLNDPRRLAIVGNDVYLTDIKVGVWHAAGPNSAALLINDDTTASGIAADAEAIYYFSNGILYRVCRDGQSAPEYLIEANSAYDVTVDDSGVYFDFGDKLGKIPK
ncbi:MAG: DUF5050 domain-containing protein [Polyangiaceae bacterium]|nr:DUF5050 domain-containing protein [Polyangiaceae bacterium]